jgi:cytochrome c-type biogenesis protein CcmH
VPVPDPSATSIAARRRLPTWWGPVTLFIVLAVALALGSGIAVGGHPSDARRVAALDAQIRCPSCEDLSVAQSSASSAVAVRNQVSRMVAEGRTTAEIEDSLVAQYGTTILLRPPTRGLTAVVWYAPVVAGGAAAAALGVYFWRRSRDFTRLRKSSEPMSTGD